MDSTERAVVQVHPHASAKHQKAGVSGGCAVTPGTELRKAGASGAARTEGHL